MSCGVLLEMMWETRQGEMQIPFKVLNDQLKFEEI